MKDSKVILAINTDPEGNIYVAGNGKVLKYDRNHQLVLEADAPAEKVLVCVTTMRFRKDEIGKLRLAPDCL